MRRKITAEQIVALRKSHSVSTRCGDSPKPKIEEIRPKRNGHPLNKPQMVLGFVENEFDSPLVREGRTSAERLSDWVSEGAEEQDRRGRLRAFLGTPRTLEQAIKVVQQRIDQKKDWDDVTPVELLGLYAYLHQSVYGVLPFDLTPDWIKAQAAARRLLENDFGGEGEDLVEFLRWVWKRERLREKQRIANGNGGFRIGWKFQFRSRDLLTEYRVDLSRQRKRSDQRK